MRHFAAVLWLALGLGSAQAATAPLYDSPAGGFAFLPPEGWTSKQEAGEAFPTLSGPVADLRAPYVVIQAVQDKRELFTFGDASVKEKLKDDRFQLGHRDAFQTADKQFALKYTFTFKAVLPNANALVVYKQAYYLVQGPPGIIYVFLANVPEAGWEKYEPALDDMMKSYHLRPVETAKLAPTKPATATGAAKP